MRVLISLIPRVTMCLPRALPPSIPEVRGSRHPPGMRLVLPGRALTRSASRAVTGRTPASPPRAAYGTFPCRNRILSRADSRSTFFTLKPEKGKRTEAEVPFPVPASLVSLSSVLAASTPAASTSRFLLPGGGAASAMLPARVRACADPGHAQPTCATRCCYYNSRRAQRLSLGALTPCDLSR